MLENSRSYKAFSSSPLSCRKYSTYFPIYDSIFHPYIGKSITFVEIGVQNGGSLIFWQNFFGPSARIIGIDLNPDAKKFSNYGFEIFIGDQADKNFWSDFINKVGDIDIVLDDGGHTYLQQIVTVESLARHINDDGLIVVEDTHTSMLSGFGNRKYSFLNYAKNISNSLTYRSGKLNKKQYDQRFFSVQFFESIVVFYINKKFTKDKSYLITNRNSSIGLRDFRYQQNFFWRFYFGFRFKIKWINKNLVIWEKIKNIFVFLYDNLISTKKLKKFFKTRN